MKVLSVCIILELISNWIYKQFNYTIFYKILPNNPTTHCELINSTINRFKGSKQLENKLAGGLKTIEARTPQFYLLPKIHKENIPDRPFVSSINSHTTKISEFVYCCLQPFVKSYTSDVINKIETISKHLPQKAILVTMDVKVLYTNIPNCEGITVVISPIIITFLRLILTQFYIQQHKVSTD